MIEYTSLSACKAEPLKQITIAIDGVKFTSSETIDEQALFFDLSKRLNLLENTLEINNQELNSIQELANDLIISNDEKNELNLRIKGIHRLYEVKSLIDSQIINTKEHAKQLRTRIAPIKMDKLKNELKEKLDSLIKSLPSEKLEPVKLSFEQELIEKAILEVGKPFDNLGKIGQVNVVKEVLSSFGEKATVEEIHKRTLAIEQAIESLVDVKDTNELVSRLEILPLSVFSTLSPKRKDTIAEKLLRISPWNNFASLNRIITLLDKQISINERKKEEEKNTIQINEGKEAFTLKIDNANNGILNVV